MTNRILFLIVLILSSPVMADSYYCDSSVRVRTLNVTWTECPRHSWSPYVRASYDGHFMNGKFYGRGTYTWEDDSVYTGQWRNGKMHGWGALTFPNGDRYSGDWRNGQLLQGMVHTGAQLFDPLNN